MNKLVALLISFYISLFLYTQVFFVKVLVLAKGSNNLFWNHITILIIFTVLIFFAIQRHIEVQSEYGAMFYIKLVLISISLFGLVFSVLYHIVPLEPMFNLPQIFDKIFASELYYTLWLIAPFLILFI